VVVREFRWEIRGTVEAEDFIFYGKGKGAGFMYTREE